MEGINRIIKKWLFVIIAIIIIGVIGGIVSASNNESEKATEELTKFEAFIKRYDYISEDKITDIRDYSIKDKEAEYYQSEFKNTGFYYATAKIGAIPNGRILMIDFNNLSNDFRVYAFMNDKEETNAIARKIIKAIDPTILNVDIDKSFSRDLGYTTYYVQFNELYGDIFNGHIIDNKIMIDSRNSLFSVIPDNDETNILLRKCTVMEASSIYTNYSNTERRNIFKDSKEKCEIRHNNSKATDFKNAINSEWEERQAEIIDDYQLKYYIDKLGW